MTTGSVPVRYARALLALGEESKTLPSLMREWSDLRTTVEGSPTLVPVLTNPRVPQAQRDRVLDDLLDRLPASAVTRKAVGLMMAKNRISLLGEVARAFEKMVEDRTGRARAVVETAAAMPDDFHRALQTTLEKVSQRTLTVERKVDPDLLGGVLARVGNTLYDGSVKSALARLREKLLTDEVA
jgi:F-type H+-transporting ATPase subunit delta